MWCSQRLRQAPTRRNCLWASPYQVWEQPFIAIWVPGYVTHPQVSLVPILGLAPHACELRAPCRCMEHHLQHCTGLIPMVANGGWVSPPTSPDLAPLTQQVVPHPCLVVPTIAPCSKTHASWSTASGPKLTAMPSGRLYLHTYMLYAPSNCGCWRCTHQHGSASL
jgi:hypothetical protein